METQNASTSCPMESYPTSSRKSILQRFCRLCLRETPVLVPFNALLKELTLADMLERILGSFTIKQTPDLPNGVCAHCVTKLDYAYNVQKEFVRNEQRLKHYVQHGDLLEKLFDMQTKIMAIQESYADKLLTDHGGGVLAEKISVAPEHEIPNMGDAEMHAASVLKKMTPPGGWAAMACECAMKPAVARSLPRTTKIARPLKRTLRSRTVLRQAIAAENPTGANMTAIDPFKCYICDTVMGSEQLLKDHLALHVGMLPHNCPECGGQDETGEPHAPITSLAMLQRHYRMHSNPLKCPHCPQRFLKYSSVYAHVRYRHELFDNPEGYTCEICGATIRYRPAFMYHMRIHHHEQKGTFTCRYCHRVFGTRARLERHERTHTGQRPFACHLCPQTFAHSGQLATHVARHNNERGHQCARCGKAFFNKAMLKQHQESHETPETRKVASGVKARQRPCLYPGCGHLAFTYQAHYMHRLRHEMAHRCEECGRRFPRECELRRHRRIYHSTEQPFKCETCGKVFLSSQSHREHMDAHANVRRFECDVCDRKFVRRRNLITHRKSHTNHRPNRCEDCGSTFKYKSDFNRHWKDKHGQTAPAIEEGTANEIVLMTEDPIIDEILTDGVQQGILVKGDIALDGTYGDLIETVEETVIVEQPLVGIGIDEVTKEEYIIEYINHA